MESKRCLPWRPSLLQRRLCKAGLEIEQGVLTMVILMIQFVAFGGALLFGRLAIRVGAKKALIIGLIVWTVVVIYAYLGLRGESRILEFWILGAFIALVMGGTQAVSRGLFANMIPQGKEAEFFSIYEVSERGNLLAGARLLSAWSTSSPAACALLLFPSFCSLWWGLALLLRVDVRRRAIVESGNRPPAVV